MTDMTRPDAMQDSDALGRRIDALEIRAAYQDQTIEDLNATLTAQWKVIEALEQTIEKLRAQMREIEEGQGVPDAPEPPPPHY